MRDREEYTVKTPISIRVAALVAAAATTFVLLQSLALLALPAPVDAPKLAQSAVPVVH